MADKLINITNVYLYTGLTASAADCYLAKKLLDENNISYKHLAYNDESQHQAVFESLSTWFWGKEKIQKPLTDFPILTWQEKYEGIDVVVLQSVQGFSKIKSCSLFKNKDLITE
jgi:hypothetical protein